MRDFLSGDISTHYHVQNKQSLTTYGNSEDSERCEPTFQKNKFYSKKLQLPFSGFTTFTNIICLHMLIVVSNFLRSE